MPLNIRSEFIYGADHKARRGLDHDGQLAELFCCQLSGSTTIRPQVEEIAETAWFSHDQALEAFKVPAQKALFQRCLDRLKEAAKGSDAA